MDDRRRYFRITDHVIFNYRVVQEAELEQGVMQLMSNRMGRDHIQSAMLGMETRLQDLITVIGRARPEFAEAIDLLNKKISLVERMLNADRDNIDQGYLKQPSSEVNISAGGVSFQSPNPLAKDAKLELELVLLPSYTYIKAYGKVVNTVALEGTGEHRISVDFDYIREDDREELIHHVLLKQSEELMQKRAEQAAKAGS